MQGTGQTVELGAVHCLSDGDPETILLRHRIPSNPTEDQEEAGRLEVRLTWDTDIGYPAHVRAIPNRHPYRGFQRPQS